MIEVFHEETVRPVDGVKAGRKYKTMLLLSIMFLITALFFTLLLFLMINSPVEGDVTMYLLTGILPVFIMAVISFVLFSVTKNKKHKYLVDYDYTFVSGELRIAKVFNGLKRKAVAKIQCSSISVFGKTSSDKFLRHKSTPGIKTVTATPNEEMLNENLYFAVCTVNGLKSILIFEPSPNLVYNIKKFSGRTVEYV